MTDIKAGTDGWIEWEGGECPVDPAQRVRVYLRAHLSRDIGRHEVGTEWEAQAADWDWKHYGKKGDIIAYRLVQS